MGTISATMVSRATTKTSERSMLSFGYRRGEGSEKPVIYSSDADEELVFFKRSEHEHSIPATYS